MGGIGKTQLFLHYARKYKEVYSACIWIDGSSDDTVKKNFREFAIQLSSKSSLFSNIETRSDGDVVHLVLRWLSEDDNKYWLLMFDNVDRDWVLNTTDTQA